MKSEEEFDVAIVQGSKAINEVEASDNPFSPENMAKMKLSQDFSGMAAVKPVITNIAVRKPYNHEFVIRAGSDWRFETSCFVDKETRDVYLVAPELMPQISGDLTPKALVLTISRNSPVPFLWPLTLPSGDGRPNRWHESAIEAAEDCGESVATSSMGYARVVLRSACRRRKFCRSRMADRLEHLELFGISIQRTINWR